MTTTHESRKSGEESANVTHPPRVTDFSIQKILATNSSSTSSTKPPNQTLPEQKGRSREQQHLPNRIVHPIAKKPVSTLGILDLSKTKGSNNLCSVPSSGLQLGPSPYHSPYIANGAAIPSNMMMAMATANAQKFYANLFPQMFYNPQTYPGTGMGYYLNSVPTISASASAIGNGQQYFPARYFTPYGAASLIQQQQHQEPSVIRLPSTLTQRTLKGSNVNGEAVQRRGDTCLGCSDAFQSKATNSNSIYARIPFTASNSEDKIRSSSSLSRNEENSTSPLKLCGRTATVTSEMAAVIPGNISTSASTSASASVSSLSPTSLSAHKNCSDISVATLRSELETITSNTEEISYKCRICEKVFGCSETLQAHEKTHKSPRYECSDCGKGFSQLRNYKYHLSVHRGTKEFAAECPECGKTFNDKGYLSSHMKIHRNKKEYECPYCPKSFNQRVAFNMHVRIHTGVKPHKCAECGKRFSRKMLLKQHMRTHSGEKPYQCSVCGKSFADRSNMTLHHRLHSGIKPFNCPICPKAFTKKHHLKTHLNYHTGCKPYICPHPNCHQAFTQSSNMRTHAKKCQYRQSETIVQHPQPLPLTLTPLSVTSKASLYPSTHITVTSSASTVTCSSSIAVTEGVPPCSLTTLNPSLIVTEGNTGILTTSKNATISAVPPTPTHNTSVFASATYDSVSALPVPGHAGPPAVMPLHSNVAGIPSVPAPLSLLGTLRPF